MTCCCSLKLFLRRFQVRPLRALTSQEQNIPFLIEPTFYNSVPVIQLFPKKKTNKQKTRFPSLQLFQLKSVKKIMFTSLCACLLAVKILVVHWLNLIKMSSSRMINRSTLNPFSQHSSILDQIPRVKLLIGFSVSIADDSRIAPNLRVSRRTGDRNCSSRKSLTNMAKLF